MCWMGRIVCFNSRIVLRIFDFVIFHVSVQIITKFYEFHDFIFQYRRFNLCYVISVQLWWVWVSNIWIEWINLVFASALNVPHVGTTTLHCFLWRTTDQFCIHSWASSRNASKTKIWTNKLVSRVFTTYFDWFQLKKSEKRE